MAREGSVKYLNTAKTAKNDEFYTIHEAGSVRETKGNLREVQKEVCD